MVEPFIGREPERAATAALLDAVPHGPAGLLLEGEAGIGKTTLVRAAMADAAARGYRVLACQPARPERRLSFAALLDLLAGVPEPVFARLPPPQRRALDVALLRAEPEGPAMDVRIVGAGVLSLLGMLVESAPVVAAIDDVQWLDAPSARVLEFAFRRLRNQPVGVVAAARTPDQVGVPLGLDRGLPEARCHRVTIGPLSLAALHHVIRARLGHAFARPVLVRIAEMSGGNPFYAIEVAEALVRSGQAPTADDVMPVPDNLRLLVTRRLRRLPLTTRAALVVVAAAAQPTPAMVRAVVARRAQGDVLAPAVRAGVLHLDGLRLRFTHPLLASAVYAAASERARRGVHRRLSTVVDEPEERARHLALGTDGPDEEVARSLDVAAQRARARGAAETAAELARRARLLTPPERVDEIHRRTVAEADFVRDAGDIAGAAHLLRPLVEVLPAGQRRAAALWKLGSLEFDGSNLVEARRTLTRALDEAGSDLSLRAAIERDMAWTVKIPSPSLHARRAAELAEQAGDPVLLSETLAVHAFAEFLRGRGLRRDLLDRATQETRSPERFLASRRPTVLYARLLMWTDDLDAARVRFETEHRRLLELGIDAHLADLLWQMSELETWAGNWCLADRYAHDGDEAAVLMDRPAVQSWTRSAQALVHAHQGLTAQARAEGEEGLALADAAGFFPAAAWNLQALAFLELSLGNPAGAYAQLERLVVARAVTGAIDPSTSRFLPDAVEALVGLGRLDEAAGLLDPFEERAKVLDRGWASAGAARCRGLLAAARGDLAAASAALEAALARYQQLPYPFEVGRTLLAKGQVHRRTKEKRAARDTLAGALAIFERLGAPLWAATARAELGRVGLRPPGRDDLTATEARVAELAATGLTNREIGRAAFLSPKSVEGVLGRVYAKLGIHSRAELGAWMAGAGRAAGGAERARVQHRARHDDIVVPAQSAMTTLSSAPSCASASSHRLSASASA